MKNHTTNRPMYSLVFALILALGASCSKKVPQVTLPGATTYTCPASESFVENYIAYNQVANKKTALRFTSTHTINGNPFVMNLQRVRMFLSSENLTAVQLDLYSSPPPLHPDQGTLLATSTVTAGLGSSDPLTQVNFVFSPVVPIATDGTTYWLVLTPTGGNYKVMVTNDNLIAGAHLAQYTSSWSYGAEYSSHISSDFKYNGCIIPTAVSNDEIIKAGFSL